jgi:hypothetical protein
MKFSGLQRRRQLIRLLVLAGMAGLASSARSQGADLGPMHYQRPWWFNGNQSDAEIFPWWLPMASVGMEVEGTSQSSKVGGSTSTYKQLSVTPLLGLENKGYVYHPNLCTFNANGDVGWNWENTSSSGTGFKNNASDHGDLQRYLVQLNFLQAKPFNANFFATQDHTYQDYGDFNTMTVDSTRYGGGVNWAGEKFTLTSEAGYWDEKNSGLSGYSEISQTYFNLSGVSLRRFGQTTFTVRANDYGNTLNDGAQQNSQNFSTSLSDSQSVGARRHINLNTGIAYSHAEYSGQQLDNFNANENLTINHSPTLDSRGNLDYNYTDLQQTDSATINRTLGSYGIHHQLYESLSSGLEAHGYYEDNTSGGSSVRYDYYGLGWTEDYNKRIAGWGRLSAGSAISLNHQDNDSSGGVITTVDEPHTLTLSGPPTFLDKPNVVQSSIVVRGPGGVVCTEGADYTIVVIGDLTQILLVPTSSILSSGDIIRVTYQSEAQYSAAYESLNSSLNFRLDLYNCIGLYARLNWMDNNAPPDVMTQTLTDWIFGADYSWRWLRAGVEFEDYISNYTEYQALRCFQNLNFHPDAKSTLGVSFNESTYRYSGGDSQNQFSVLAHYQLRLAGGFAWFADGGFIYLQVFDSDQTSGTARTGLTWSRGKLSARAGYEFSQQNSGSGTTSQEFQRNYFYMNLKRMF